VRPLDPRLLRYARSARAYLLLTVGLGVATAGLVVAQAYLLSRGITDVFQQDAAGSSLTPLVVGLLAVVAGRSLVGWLQESAAHRSSAAVKHQLRTRLLDHAVSLGPQWLAGRRTSDLTVLATRGLDALDGYFARYLPQLVLAVVVPLTVIGVVATQDVLSAVVILVTVPLIPVFMVLIGWTTQRAQQRQWSTLERLAGYFLDVVAGLPTLKVFGRAKAQADGLRDVGDRYRRTTMKVLRISFLSSFALELIATISVALVAVEIGIRLVDGGLSLFIGLFVLVLAPEAYLPLRLVGQHFHASQEGLTAASRAFEVLEAEPAPAGGQAPAPDLSATTVQLRGVTVRYPGRDDAGLDDATLAIRPGRTLAVVGPSGCGKSTLLAVLLGLVRPDDGEVVLEGPPGSVRLRDVGVDSWRRQLAWVPQAPHFFAGTVADNVRLAVPDADDEAVAAALAEVGADFVADLPHGIGTVLGDGGAGLSTGQRQRLALARAFLRDAPLVLLDEPTAGLDGVTEQRVVDAVRRLAQRRTVVLVAHRPALVELADDVVTLGLPVVAR
jgi:ATP-binding cassette, subfamily C, bacterial CydCD